MKKIWSNLKWWHTVLFVNDEKIDLHDYSKVGLPKSKE